MTTLISNDSFFSAHSLNNFLSGKEAIQEILHSPPVLRQERLWSNTEEFSYFITGYILTIGSFFLQVLCMTDLAKTVWVESRHLLANGAALKAEKVFQEKLLVNSINTHRVDTADYFLQPPAPTSLLTIHAPGSLRFFHRDGICRGMCHWFIHLYFLAREKISDSHQLMVAIGKQFELGAPSQAAFLHSLDFPSLLDLLKLDTQNDFLKISTKDKTNEQIVQEIYACPPGVYGIYTSTHQMVYIKCDLVNQFLFDPKQGVIQISSIDVLHNSMQHYLEMHNPQQEILLDRYRGTLS